MNTVINNYIPFENYSDLLTVEDIQAALGIGRNTAYQLINQNLIDHIRIGKKIRVPKRCLIDYVYGQCDNSASNGGQICAGAVMYGRQL